MVFLIIIIMEKNIKLIIKKKYKTNKIYFYNEEYNDFYKEYEYNNKNIFSLNFNYIYNFILYLLKKYKILLIVIIIFIFIIIKYFE
jgi:hypothetical protein